MKHILSLLAFLLLCSLSNMDTAAQTTLSLQDCITYGLENSPQLQRAQLDVPKSKARFQEGLASYLPQVNGSASFNNNLKLATQILPGEVFGQPGEDVAVQFGTKYTFSGGIDVSQTIYNQSLITGLQAAKASQELAGLQVRKTKEELLYDMATTYYATQVVYLQKEIVVSNLSEIKELLRITKLQYDNGVVQKIDYDRLFINQTNLQTELATLSQNEEQQLRLLKFYMGMPIDSTIALTQLDVDSELSEKSPYQYTGSQIDAKILDLQYQLQHINLKQIRAEYLPTLSMSLGYSYQAQQNSANLFSSDTEWFPIANLGFALKVPIFDGFNKSARAKQVKLNLEQLDWDKRQLRQQLNMQESNAQGNWATQQQALQTHQATVKLAEEVYDITQLQYKEGVIPMAELLQAETALKESQSNYVSAAIQVKLAELEWLKASGNIVDGY